MYTVFMTPGKPKVLKRNNRKTILDLLRSSETTTVADISKKVGLSKTTVMKILEYYTNQKLILKVGKGISTDEGGKKPVLFRFNSTYKYIIAVHIFPSEVYAAIFDLRLNLLYDLSDRIFKNESPEIVVRKIKAIIEVLMDLTQINNERLAGIAVGTHGITNFDSGTVSTSPHFPSWGENTPLRDMLIKSISPDIPFFIDNQIRFQTFAEKNIGIGKNKRNIIVIEGGEGLVAGIMMNNEIHRGVHYLAGEIGHMILSPDDTTICSCGGTGCFEALISVKNVLERTKTEIKLHADSVLFQKDTDQNREISIESIFSAAENGDQFARYILQDVLKWFSVGISNIMLMYDPEIIIIQGIYSKAGEWFLNRLRTLSNACSLTRIEKNIEIQYSNLGKERGVLGGAAFVLSDYFSNEKLYDL